MRLFYLLTFFFVLFGCTNKPLQPEIGAHIHTLKILPVTWSPKEFTYIGREQAWGMALGAGAGTLAGAATGASKIGQAALGGAGLAAGMKVGDLASMPTYQAIISSMSINQIDLGEIVKSQFENQLNTLNKFKVVDVDAQADAEIQLTVVNWGFGLTQGFSSVMYPTMKVEAEMKQGKVVVWRHGNYITPFNGDNTYAFTPLEYRTDPEKLKAALNGVATIISKKLVENLGK
jgi:hypothetical protein